MCRSLLMLAGFMLLAASIPAWPQTQSPTPTPAQKIPVMDGGAGSCSLELTVLTRDGKPVLGADVKVHIEYGFVGIRKLDLEAYTNADGKLKFAGLPSRVRHPPLTFHASKDQMTGIATYDPATECEAKHDLPLDTQKPTQ